MIKSVLLSRLYLAHPVARLLAGMGLLIPAILSHSVFVTLFLALAGASLIRLFDGSWLAIHRLVRMLGWFVIPILLLHALLSPGQLIFPGTGFPVTREGLWHGGLLSSRLAAIFIMALVWFRLCSHSEWLGMIASVPLFGRKLLPYLLMMRPLHAEIRMRLQLIHRQYRLRRRWRDVPDLLLSACQHALSTAAPVARVLWLRWPESIDFNAGHDAKGLFNIETMAVAGFGLSTLLIFVIAGG
ncbi:hypothetical protein FE236_12655 [Mariprofundus erugo]|uniref:Energy-coupling factor transporter transmembrane protein EcfT n=1 Tax=Mariprofundus erugo TaxID=2528639 RepID=A0A5R9GRX1_9PROT|nr:hypothetical protein [Mariprofundus erugo]TLS67649.1 hypothetical protein FEF65_06970 [Mariprofundus erugo]TLS73856.1 hypothetical protein FE236_12655 [Mariprofundus erugo]